jgi:hypothetical protein
MSLTINSHLFPAQHKRICLSNGSALCSLWGKNWSILSPAEKEAGLFTANARVRSQFRSCTILVDEEALWHVFLRVLRFSPANIIPPTVHSHAAPSRTNVRSLETFHKAVHLRKSKSIGQKITPILRYASWLLWSCLGRAKEACHTRLCSGRLQFRATGIC